MLSLLSVWLGLGCLAVSVAMLVYRPWFSDASVTIALYSAAASMCFAGMVLFSLRRRDSIEVGVAMQRTQCKVALFLALLGAGIIYGLVNAAERAPVDPVPSADIALYLRFRGSGPISRSELGIVRSDQRGSLNETGV